MDDPQITKVTVHGNTGEVMVKGAHGPEAVRKEGGEWKLDLKPSG